MEISQLIKTLSKYDVHYLLCGGLAVIIYGVPRMTTDIDLVLSFNENNLDKFDRALKELGYQNRIPVPLKSLADSKERTEVVKTKNLIAYSYFSNTGAMTVDVLLDMPVAFDDLWARKEIRSQGAYEVYMVSFDDLILLKTYSNRDQDKEDISLLKKLRGI
jgi:hypothetical protein